MPDKNTSSDNRDRASVASYDSTGKQKSFRRLFARFAEKTSMVGVPYIHMTKLWWAKVIWSVLLLGAIVVMSLHLWFLFDQYYNWPVITKVELGFKTLEFPQVTICNTNIMHKKRFYDSTGAEELRQLVEDLEPENFVSDQFDPNFSYTTDSATDTSQTTPAGDQPTPTQSGTGNERRKRYIREYDNVNISKYDPDYENFEDDYYDDADYYLEPREKQTVLKELFTKLYMDIDKVERDYLGHQISDMLIECTFNERKCTAK
ncbi:amiloride-sensitive sodium channel subunit beta-like [Mercenaria mercenaria]|uniref:amiloride-sensitive sodium channel subunit beta-like n=1 Tax=Mercenaria mercenaria TaxID=6596 RepID=UPI00234EAC1C|nr:amiloride-sensitive sodium channel subunit beta-like [Mercenaria mercenaria]